MLCAITAIFEFLSLALQFNFWLLHLFEMPPPPLLIARTFYRIYHTVLKVC